MMVGVAQAAVRLAATPLSSCLDLSGPPWRDGRSRAIAITESLARLVAAIRIGGVRFRDGETKTKIKCAFLRGGGNWGQRGKSPKNAVFHGERHMTINLAPGDHPNSRIKRSENVGANENLSCGFPSIPGIAPGVAPRITGFVFLKSRNAIPRMDFRIPRIAFWIPRAAPRIPRNSPRTLSLRMAFHSKGAFPEIWGGPQASE